MEQIAKRSQGAVSKKVKTKKSKVLVTGVAGFIGFHLATELLAQGRVVIGMDSLTDYYDPRIKKKRLDILKKKRNFSFYKLNIAKYEELETILKKEKPDEIVHLAAQAGVRYSLINPQAYIESNDLGSLNIFEVAKRLRLPRVVYASSSSVYGANTESPMREDQRVDRPISVYAATKRSNELLAHAYNHLYGLETIGLRFFTVYGIWGRPDLALFKFTKRIFAGKPIDVYNRGRMKRNFTHISDVVAGILAVLDKEPTGSYELYNLGGPDTLSLEDFISLIEREVGKKSKRRLLPMQAGDVPDTIADWSKAEQDLGFVPRISIAKGVAEFVRWFRENERFLQTLRDS